MKKFYVKAIMDKDVFDELGYYPESRVAIIEGHPIDTEILVAKEIWKIAGKSSDYGNALMDLLGEEIYNKIMIIQRG